MAEKAGLSSFVTYVSGVVGFSQRRWFGSFQTSHSFTHGYRFAAAAANAAVRPARRSVERDHWCDPAIAQSFEHRVRVPPVPLPANLLDLVPVDGEANEVDADPVELVEPLVERPRSVDEPRIVLKAVADERRRFGGLGDSQQRRDGPCEHEDPAHPTTVAAAQDVHGRAEER